MMDAKKDENEDLVDLVDVNHGNSFVILSTVLTSIINRVATVKDYHLMSRVSMVAIILC